MSLYELNSHFENALKPGFYLTSDLQVDSQKKDTLATIFHKAIERIDGDLKTLEERKVSEDIDLLNKLKASGESLYNNRYCSRGNRLKRSILHFLSTHIPAIFKKILPVSLNEVDSREQAVLKAKEAYYVKLEQHLTRLQALKELQELVADLNKHRTITLDQGITYLELIQKSKVDIEKMNLGLKLDSISFKNWSKTQINQFLPYLKEYKTLDFSEAIDLTEADVNQFMEKGWITHLLTIQLKNDPQFKTLWNAQKQLYEEIEYMKKALPALEKQGFFSYDQFSEILQRCLQNLAKHPPHIVSSLLAECQLEESLITLLITHRDPLKEALIKKNEAKLKELLQSTRWSSALIPLSESSVELVCTKIPGTQEFKVNGIEKHRHFNSKFSIKAESLPFLADFMGKTPTCRPRLIEITVGPSSDLSLMIDALFKLTTLDSPPYFTLHQLTSISFKKLTKYDAHKIIELLAKSNCPQLKEIDLSETDLTLDSYQMLIDLCPTFEVLKECLAYCPTPEKLKFPTSIFQQPSVNLQGYTPEQIKKLLPQFTSIQQLTLSIDDQTLKAFIHQGLLSTIKELTLETCKGLTTDCIQNLVKLSNLTSLSLPKDLGEGSIPLKDLPKFDQPFKIALFYLSAPILRKHIHQFYTGFSNWASVFQIPLASQNDFPVFPKHHHTLDPHSVEWWLYQKDYEKLKGENSIKTIWADNSGSLNDDNLIDFISRFPKLETLSLHNCRQLTLKGMESLTKYILEKKTFLKTIDLTNCPQFTIEDLNDFNYVCESKNIQLIYNKFPITLEITDKDLSEPNGLNQKLSVVPLNRLVKLSFKGCTTLTDAMLSDVFNHLCTDFFIENGEHQLIANPKRLNIVELNLEGCSQITGFAFTKEADNGGWKTRDLGSLTYIAFQGTLITQKDSEFLETTYPSLQFHLSENDFYTIHPKDILKQCQQQMNWSRIPRIQAYIFKQLFANPPVSMLEKESLHFNLNDYNDRKLEFVHEIPGEGSFPFSLNINQEILYTHSPKFRNMFRVGGEFFKSGLISYQNQHTSEKACQALVKLIMGQKEVIETLDWKSASELSELIKPEYFDLPNYKSYLLLIQDQIVKQFDLSKAQAMIDHARQLNNQTLLGIYKKTLFLLVPSRPDQIQEIEVETLLEDIRVIARENNWAIILDRITDLQIQLAQKEMGSQDWF